MLNKSLDPSARSFSLKPGGKSGKGLQALTNPGKSSSKQRKEMRVWSQKDAEESDFPGATGPGSGMHDGHFVFMQ